MDFSSFLEVAKYPSKEEDALPVQRYRSRLPCACGLQQSSLTASPTLCSPVASPMLALPHAAAAAPVKPETPQAVSRIVQRG